ncbi:TnsD family Tn7-like transposition protein [Pseudoalteromonas spongiae]|uniref:TnsD family Tn7-like transposition protein n=1 Tax=Pseudoalteromonas spongiae TaxID=298657 RepID=UPI00110A36C4|nr:TnsD family Tn7-like transposition protein [Pseudoalteromonas spongiae]TMO84835.1 hypothetical protein CWC15_09635 [Pseudoalteromonas spongiae]
MFSLQLKQGECLYSVITRHWQRLGAPSSYRYRRLLGLPSRHRVHPFLTTHLSVIGQKFGIDAELLLNAHTLYPIFRLVIPDSRKLAHSMLGSGKPSPVLIARLPQVACDSPFTIRCCPVCVEIERNQKGFAVWQLKHQIPGVVACDVHGVILNEYIMGDGGADRNFLPIPLSKHLRHKDASQQDILLAKSSTFLLHECCCKFSNHIEFMDWLQHKLNYTGLLTEGGYIRQKELEQVISSTFSDHVGIEFRQSNSLFSKACIVSRKGHQNCAHPLAYAILAYTLSSIKASGNTRADKNQVTAEEFPLPEMLEDARNGLSINQLCHKYSRSKCFVTRQLEINEIPHASNSMATDIAIKEKILSLAKMGKSRESIVEELNVGIGLVDKLICNTPGITDLRKSLRHQQKIKHSTEKIKQVCRENPELSRTQVRNLAETEYATLYKNNKPLLFSLLPEPQQPKPTGRKRKK